MVGRLVALLLLVALALPLPTIGGEGRGASEPSAGRHVEGVVLVGFRSGATAPNRALARRSVSAAAHRPITPLAPDLELLTLPPGRSVADAVRELRRHGSVRFAEPDWIVTADATPNDTYYTSGDLWGMYGPTTSPSGTYGSRAGAAWAAGQFGSDDVYVGVIDTGVQVTHPDLAPNIWVNPYEIAGNKIDDDGNGYVDDVHGWDFRNGNASVYDGPFDYHGTHVAGTIGAAGGNGTGVVGVNWAVTMIIAKFIHKDVGSISGAIAAIDYITDLKLRHGLNIVATNSSWGGPDFSTALVDAINRAGDAGIVFVAAAGNAEADVESTPFYPAAHTCTTRFDDDTPRGWDCIVSVAGIDRFGALAGFSNYGPTSVDLGAPGANIVSTYPSSDYAMLSGTSMAAPHVTGALALRASCPAALAASELRARVVGTTVATASLAGKTVTGGRLDAAAMVADCDADAPPRAVLTLPTAAVKTGPVVATAWFTTAVTGLAPGDFTIGGTSGGWSVGSVSGSGAGPYSITLTATAPGEGTLWLRLNAGTVSAGGVSGPPTAITSGTIKVDRTRPIATAPSAAIRAGAALSGTAIPIRLSWSGTDGAGSGIVRYELAQSTDGGSTWSFVTTSLLSPSHELAVPSSGSRRFRVRAVDGAGNVGAWATGPVFRPRLVQDGSSALSYSGSWSKSTWSLYSGGTARHTGVVKRSVTYTFSGRSIGFVTTLASNRGVVKIKVDGVLVAKIDLVSAGTAYRRVVFSKTWSKAGTHTIKLIVVGTSGRPRVDLDAFAILR